MHEGDPRGQIREPFAGANADKMCTQLPRAAGRAGRASPRTRTTIRLARARRCVGCHMPRIVYGVLDIHRSHRIEIPKPPPAIRRRLGAGRPDACTLCHVEGARRPRDGPGVASLLALFACDPVGRAVAADALGRAPSFGGDERARRLGALLGSMASDAIRRSATSPGGACAG